MNAPVPIEKRKPLTRREALQLAFDQDGRCKCGCGEKLDALREGVTDEHRVPLALGGTNDLSNRELWRAPCSAAKTKRDRAAIAKAKRLSGETGNAPKRPIRGRTQIQSRGFDKTRSRGFDGQVRPRTTRGHTAEDVSAAKSTASREAKRPNNTSGDL